MAFAGGFTHDVFLSYARIDNQPLLRDQEGWVAVLHRALEVRLQQLLGNRTPAIWRDDRHLRGYEYFAQAITVQLPQTALLLPVLSPSYLQSDWCRRELREFCQHAAQPPYETVDHRSRLFKVVKTPLPHEDHPPELQGLLGYEFYEVDPLTQRPREWRPEPGTPYWDKLEDLALDMAQALQHLAQEAPVQAAPAQPPPRERTVYVAETTSDLSLARDQLIRELQRHGYHILPDQPLLMHGPALRQAVQAALERCACSVHCLGAYYGLIPEQETLSVVQLQLALALEGQQPRYLWCPRGMQSQESRQATFLGYVQDEVTARPGVELLHTSLEELKTFLHDMLEAPPPPVPPTAETPTAPRLYLWCAPEDEGDVQPLADYLFAQGVDVTLPLFDGDAAQRQADHEAELTTCDALLIYHGQSSAAWLRTVMRDLPAVAAQRQARPLHVTAIYVAGPATPQKQQVRSREALVMQYFTPFVPQAMQPVLARLLPGRSGDQP